jgi:hypothetical protein
MLQRKILALARLAGISGLAGLAGLAGLGQVRLKVANKYDWHGLLGKNFYYHKL